MRLLDNRSTNLGSEVGHAGIGWPGASEKFDSQVMAIFTLAQDMITHETCQSVLCETE